MLVTGVEDISCDILNFVLKFAIKWSRKQSSINVFEANQWLVVDN